MKMQDFGNLCAYLAKTSQGTWEDAIAQAKVIHRIATRLGRGLDVKQVERAMTKAKKVTGLDWDTTGTHLVVFDQFDNIHFNLPLKGAK